MIYTKHKTNKQKSLTEIRITKKRSSKNNLGDLFIFGHLGFILTLFVLIVNNNVVKIEQSDFYIAKL
ncbi:MAG: hypothetical protein P8K68_01600, partial [Algibacter sp.]|uniref:hypothetical protein n=1 Tax=Algibacter sp. TaxID=1872428 RepID=UPI002635B8D0